MCRFTNALDGCSPSCLTTNLERSESYRQNPKTKWVFRILPTIQETQEDENETCEDDEKQRQFDKETRYSTFSSSFCLPSLMSHLGETTNGLDNGAQLNLLKKSNKTEDLETEDRRIYSSAKKSVKTPNKSTKREERQRTNFKGFGDFFPQDFLSDFDENETAEIGVKRYLEKQRVEWSNMNCREQELRRVLHKNKGPEIESWLHFFG